MGLQEFLKKMWVSITGHDPEGMDGLYRMETADVGLPTDGDVRHKITAHSPVQAPPGVEYYKDANGDMAWKWGRDTSGNYRVLPYTASAPATGMDVFQARVASVGPYMSNGSGLLVTGGGSGSPPAMLAKSISITAQADGSVTSAELLASAGAGDKWTIYHIALSAGDLAVAGEAKQLTISDGIGYVSAGQCVHGPLIQATAATAINYSAPAGYFGNAEVMTLSIQYRESV